MSAEMDILITEWQDLPAGGNTPERVLAIGDVHGMADLLDALLCHLQTDPDAHIVFLGDLNDRGPEGVRAINLAWDAKNRFRKRTYLSGNHEICLMDALKNPHENLAFQFWFHNYHGYPMCDELDIPGNATIDEMVPLLVEAMPQGFLDHVQTAPGYTIIGDLIFVHAGIPPYGDRKRFLGMGPLDGYSRGEHWSMIRDRSGNVVIYDNALPATDGSDARGFTVLPVGS